MKTLVKLLVCLFVTGCSAHVQNPRGNDEDGGQPPILVTVSEDAGSDAIEAPDAVTAEEVSVEVVAETEEEVEVASPQTLAEKFVAAGGQKLCLAMVHALNPDWRMDACLGIQPGLNGEDRKTECENQRRPLIKFAEDVCTTVIAESLRLDLDPGLVLSVIERESSFGRATWDSKTRAYEVQTDVCHLTLPKSRIVNRRPGRRTGTELITWTYGPQAPNAGRVARNSQPVIVEEENDDQVVLNTCAAGEGGIMQTTARELRIAGDAIGMTGTIARRRAIMETDPVLQVRLGCQALADHRDLVPEDRRGDWTQWIFVYNTGSITLTEHGRAYRGKIIRHYLAACRGWMQMDEADPMSIRDVEDVWPECQRIEAAQDTLQSE